MWFRIRLYAYLAKQEYTHAFTPKHTRIFFPADSYSNSLLFNTDVLPVTICANGLLGYLLGKV